MRLDLNMKSGLELLRAAWVKQVMNFFVIDFHVGHFDLELNGIVAIRTNFREQLVTQSGNNSRLTRTSAHHRKTFPRT